MKISKTNIGKTSLITIGIGLITIGYNQVEAENFEVGAILIGLGVACILIGFALKEEE